MSTFKDFKTFIIDLDGVLTDLAWDYEFWSNRLPMEWARRRGIGYDDARTEFREAANKVAGTKAWYSNDYWSAYTGVDVDVEKERFSKYIRPNLGAEAFLKKCRASGAEVIIATNADHKDILLKLVAMGLDDFITRKGEYLIDEVVYSPGNTGYSKETPEFWSYLIKDCKIETADPSKVLVIDDSPKMLNKALTSSIKECGESFAGCLVLSPQIGIDVPPNSYWENVIQTKNLQDLYRILING